MESGHIAIFIDTVNTSNMTSPKKITLEEMNWVMTRVLGKGSFGTVFLAVSTSPGAKRIAIKSINYHHRLLVLREELTMILLRGCPEIVQCYGSQLTVKDGKKMCNLLLEYAPHGTLSDHITANKFFNENVVRIYTRMILKGLSFMHKKRVTHCDLKPKNILLFPSSQKGIYQLKISDFGLSKSCFDEDTEFGIVKFRGTPDYMSPESAVGLIEMPLDIWSLGCIVIEMITGHNPWCMLLDSKAVMYKLIIEKVVPHIPSKVSQDCKDFLNKCFLHDPRKRWTADMLLNHSFVQL